MRRLLIICLLFPLIAFAKPAFKQGVDYKLVPQSKVHLVEKAKPGKVQVIEFFSYGCPWCYRVEPNVEAWLKKKPRYVEFSRVPVVFANSWLMYAKAYYTAKALGVEGKITPAIFKALHQERRKLKNQADMAKFFEAHGVKKADFENAFSFSPAIDAQVKSGQQYMEAFQVYGVPAVVVNGKYKTDAALAKGDGKRMMQIVDYLVKKAKKSN